MDFQHRILPFYMTYPEAEYGSPGQYPQGEMGYRNQGQYSQGEMGYRNQGQYSQGEMGYRNQGQYPQGEMGYRNQGQYPQGEMGYRNQGQYLQGEMGYRNPGQYPQGPNGSPNPRQQISAERGYPYPLQYSQSDAMRDLEYLQQLYPYEVRRYQRRVAEILDRMDYEGSMIYDEYPDRVGLERLVNTVWSIIKREEENGESDISQSQETWEWIRALLFVLLNTEVYKRRNGSRRRFPRLL